MNEARRRLPRVVGGAALGLSLVLAAYWPALCGGFLWDDDAHVTRPALRSLHGLGRIWSEMGATQQYYPVLHTAFWVEHRLWGDAVLGYHLANLLLHAGAAALLVLVLRRVSVPGAGLAGLIFALHPVAVESVAWISEQKNTLSTVFYLGAALLFLWWREARPHPWRPAAYLAATVLFLLALLTKSVTATLPAALFAVSWWRRGRVSGKEDVLPLLPWFVSAAGMGVLTAWVESRYIGAHGADFNLGAVQRGLLACRIVGFYLGKLLWPANLTFVYPHWTVVVSDLRTWLPLFGAIAATAALVRARRRCPGGLLAWVLFWTALFPALGFFNVYPFVYSYVADHFQYLALLGAAGAGGACWARWQDGSRSKPALRRHMPGVCAGALIAGLGALSHAQSSIYRDLPTLYRVTLSRNPACWMAYNNLGVWEKDHGHWDEAEADYQAALRIRPDYPDAHNNLGDVRSHQPGRMAEAIAEFETALRLKPDYAEAHNNLGDAWSTVPGRLDDAIAEYRAALWIKPDYAEAHNNLGSAWAAIPGRLDQAIAEYETALRLKPDCAEAHNNLGNAWAGLPGRLPDAIAQYQAALRINPSYAEAHNNLGTAWFNFPGHLAQAVEEYRTALRLKPDYAEAHNNLANAWAGLGGHQEDALREYRTALRLSPDNATTHFNLAVTLAGIPGRIPEAVEELRTVLRLQPGNEKAARAFAELAAPR